MKAQKARERETQTAQSKLADEALSDAMQRMRESGGVPADAVAVMAHEMKNPLNAILGFTEMLRSETYGTHADPRYKEYSEAAYPFWSGIPRCGAWV